MAVVCLFTNVFIYSNNILVNFFLLTLCNFFCVDIYHIKELLIIFFACDVKVIYYRCYC